MESEFQVRYDADSISSMAFWRRPLHEQEARFEAMRRESPVSWQPRPENDLGAPDAAGGFWAVVCHKDIVTVSRDPKTYISGAGVAIDDMPMDLQIRFVSFLGMDPPRHTRIRRAVSSVFTPRQIAKMEQIMQERATLVVDQLLQKGPCDFVTNVAGRLPMWISSEMLGVPLVDQHRLVAAGDVFVGRSDPKLYGGMSAEDAVMTALKTMEAIGLEMVESRRRRPSGDLMTLLTDAADSEEDPLTDEEIIGAFIFLTLAGNETTRNATAIAMKALTDNPDQRAWLMGDYEGRIKVAIDEFLRWATPSNQMSRTAAADTELHGQAIAAGEKVVMFYGSGNRDALVFDDPYSFDLSRSPNPHLTFGGGGPHHCLGAILARSTLKTIFRELLSRVPDIEAGDPEYLLSNEMRAVLSMPCTFSA